MFRVTFCRSCFLLRHVFVTTRRTIRHRITGCNTFVK
ncbi:hypothetical protein VPHK391_0080 [Vibrio phage K391]